MEFGSMDFFDQWIFGSLIFWINIRKWNKIGPKLEKWIKISKREQNWKMDQKSEKMDQN